MSRIALLFPGQGSQYIGMCQDLYNRYPIVKQTFEEAEDVLDMDLQKLCFYGDMKELTKTSNTQIALLTASVAMFRTFMENVSIEPYCLAGHSLGEISALTCAGAIDFQDSLKIVRKRGQLMQMVSESGCGIMAAVSNIHEDVIRKHLEDIQEGAGIAQLACNNSYRQNVISGDKKLIERICSELEKEGASIKYLNVSGPFHSKLMEGASKEFEDELKRYSYNDLKWQVISNTNAKKYTNKNEIIKNLKKQLVSPVLWVDIMEELVKHNVDIGVELGPKKTLKNLINKSINGIETYSFDLKEDREYLLNKLVDRYNAESFVRKCLSISICTENNNWNNDDYENYIVKSIDKLKKLYGVCKSNEVNESDVMTQALDLLCSVLFNKKISIDEQRSRINSLREYTINSDILKKIVKEGEADA